MKSKPIIVMSGQVGAGKSTLANDLAREYQAIVIKTHECIEAEFKYMAMERRFLQKFGEKLDRKTKGAWVRDALLKIIEERRLSLDRLLIVDAVRIEGQITALRETFGARIIHIHLTAPEDVLAYRYQQRQTRKIKELSSYADVQANKTEKGVRKLANIADIVIDSNRNSMSDVLVRAAAHIGLYGRDYSRLVDVLVGGQFGSEGKGQVAAYLSSEYDILLRVGGPNAGHKVYEEPNPYTFHQLPSGTRVSSAQIVIGPGAVINPSVLLREIADCSVDVNRLAIDSNAMVITERHIKQEAQLQKSIGSTGQGVGAATAEKILGRAKKQVKLARDVRELKPFVQDTCAILERAFYRGQRVLLEGTQGTGLSIHHGYYPHVTSRDTTVAGCLAEAGISPSRVRKVIMVCRTYPIRVESPEAEGTTSGPMSQEIDWEMVAKRSAISIEELQETEKTSTTNRKRRVGEFDWALLRKAASLNAPTDIAITFADYLSIKNRDARRYQQLEAETIRFIDEVERVATAPVSLISTRFHFRSIIDRRAW